MTAAIRVTPPDRSVVEGLLPWQLDAVAKAAAGGHWLWWADPGCGKTMAAIRHARQRRLLGFRGPSVYCCPSSLTRQVAREAARFWPGAKIARIATSRDAIPADADLIIVGYGLLSRASGLTARLRALQINVLICDESHFLRNWNTQRTGMVLLAPDSLAANAQQRIFLSGSPLVNSAGDLWPTVARLGARALAVDVPGGKPRAISRGAFESKFVVFADKRIGGRIIRLPVGSKNLEELRTALRPHMVRVHLRDVVAGLPALRCPVLPLDVNLSAVPVLPPEIARLVDQLTREIAVADGDERPRLEAELVGVLNDAEVGLSTWRRILGENKAAAVAAALIDRLEAGEPQALVFNHHRAVGDAILSALRQAGIPAEILRGGVTGQEKDRIVASFVAGTTRVIVCQHDSAGVGTDGLQCCRYAICAESPWTAAALQQSCARLLRLGQRNGVLVEMAVVPGSLDEILSDIVARKATDAAAFNV